MDRYLRKIDESDFNYLMRLVEIKMEEKPDDLDWVDIVSYCNLNCHYDSLRKAMQPEGYGGYAIYKKLKDDIGKGVISEEDVWKEFEIKKIELQKEKAKIRTLRLDMNRIIRESSRTELLHEEFLEEIKKNCAVPIPKFEALKLQNTSKAYILSFADSHLGKQFKSITNEYDINIAYDRFNKLLSEVVEIIEENNINKLIILALGDLIEGMCLRISQLQQLQVGMVSQTVQFMRFIVSWLNELSRYTEITYHQTPYSNHSQIRPFGTKANEFASEDMEKIIFTYIYDILQSNPRITIEECDKKYVMFKIFDYNVIACHGHGIKDRKRFLKDVGEKYKIFFDYGFFAHYHSNNITNVGEGATNNCDIISVPSIMGTDDYADDLFVGSKAGATLIEFTERQGKRKTYDIILN